MFISFPGKIHLITTDEALSKASEGLLASTALGFDTETRPSFRKGEVFKVALLQLANDTDAYIIRLHFIKHFGVLKTILENDSVLKVGVAVRDDIKQLQKTFNFIPRNIVELQDLAKVKGLQNFGLKGMTEEVLQAPLTKGPKLTNWEAHTLTEQQIMYAATDAWVGLAIYRKLNE